MIVCADCLQEIAKDAESGVYYHLPPMSYECEGYYVPPLDLSNQKDTLDELKSLSLTVDELDDRIAQGLGWLSQNGLYEDKKFIELRNILDGEGD